MRDRMITRALGMTKKRTRCVMVGTRLTAAQARVARRLARDQGVTLAAWIANAITEKLARAEAEPARIVDFAAAETRRVVAAIGGGNS